MQFPARAEANAPMSRATSGRLRSRSAYFVLTRSAVRRRRFSGGNGDGMASVFASSPPPRTETKYGSGESVAEKRTAPRHFAMDSSRKREASRQKRRTTTSLPRCERSVTYSGP